MSLRKSPRLARSAAAAPPLKQKGSTKKSTASDEETASETSSEEGEVFVFREDRGQTIRDPLLPKPLTSTTIRKDISMEEVGLHKSKDDIWVAIDGNVYDVTRFVETHPGGWLPMAALAGRDCTDAFANYHPARVYKNLLPRFLIGTVKDYEVSEFQAGHRQIRQKLLEAGLFKIDPWYYVKIGVWLTLLFFSALALTLTSEGSRLQRLVGAVVLGLFWQQIAFMGHDAGHNSVTHDWDFDNMLGLFIGNFMTGIGTSWWKRSHNVHHIVCNSIEHDPDIQHMPLFAVTPNIFNGSSGHEHGKFWTTYHQRWVEFDSVARFMVSHQHWLFYPIMALARFNLYAQSYLLLLDPKEPDSDFGGKKVGSWRRRAELVCLFGFCVWAGALLAYMPVSHSGFDNSDQSFSPFVERLLYVLLSHAVAGVLHVQICLSHFSMDTYHDFGGVNEKGEQDDSDEWFRMQVATTMNIDCPWYLDWFHGGLQFQIEHHLWPRLPRHNLRKASELVRAFCKEHGVHYHMPRWIEAQKELIASLKEVAMNARTSTLSDGGFYTSQLWEGMNAQG